jgi:hypothetical protein
MFQHKSLHPQPSTSDSCLQSAIIIRVVSDDEVPSLFRIVECKNETCLESTTDCCSKQFRLETDHDVMNLPFSALTFDDEVGPKTRLK